MKYITRAPILRAKTKTTYKRKEKSHYLTVLKWNTYSFTQKKKQGKQIIN